MNYVIGVVVGIYLFIVSFFLLVPLGGLAEFYNDVSGDSSIEIHNLQKESGSTLELRYNGASVADIDGYSLLALVVLNGAYIDGLNLKGLAASFFPAKINSAFLFVPIWSLSPTFWFSGDFGDGSGEFSPFSGVLKITLTPTDEFKKQNSFLLSKGRADGDSFVFEYKL